MALYLLVIWIWFKIKGRTKEVILFSKPYLIWDSVMCQSIWLAPTAFQMSFVHFKLVQRHV